MRIMENISLIGTQINCVVKEVCRVYGKVIAIQRITSEYRLIE